jgi:hypothetical protein
MLPHRLTGKPPTTSSGATNLAVRPSVLMKNLSIPTALIIAILAFGDKYSLPHSESKLRPGRRPSWGQPSGDRRRVRNAMRSLGRETGYPLMVLLIRL